MCADNSGRMSSIIRPRWEVTFREPIDKSDVFAQLIRRHDEALMIKITRRRMLAIGVGALTWPMAGHAQQAPLVVYRDPDCGCCLGWVRHLRAAGFVADVQETKDLDAVKQRLSVPNDLAACHTAELAGYVIEGHVPALALIRLLAERPKALGLAVPGMPAGSPGMEGANPEAYDVVLFGKGTRQRYMRFIGEKAVG